MGRTTKKAARLVSLVTAVGLVVSLAACAPTVVRTVPEAPKPAGEFPADVSAQFDEAIAHAITLSGASGAIAGVWAPWAGSWEASPGTTKPGGGTDLSTDMSFRIGTNTKMVTCTVLLALVDEGVVGLDDEVHTHMPSTPGIEGMTFRQLCQNTGGIGDYSGGLKSIFVNNPERIWPPLELLSAGLPLSRTGEPGAKYASSNSGFMLLGMALRSVTGKSWPELYETHVLGPLGLSHTSFPASTDLTIPGDHPDGLAYELGAKNAPQCDALVNVTALSPSMYSVAGGMISTLDDSRKMIEAIADGTLVTPTSASAQWETVSEGEKVPEWRGYGLGAEQLGPMRGSAGEISGFLSVMLSDPKSGLTVVVALNNSAAGSAFALSLGEQLAAIAATAPATISGAPEAPTLPWTADEAGADVAKRAVCQPKPEG